MTINENKVIVPKPLGLLAISKFLLDLKLWD